MMMEIDIGKIQSRESFVTKELSKAQLSDKNLDGLESLEGSKVDQQVQVIQKFIKDFLKKNHSNFIYFIIMRMRLNLHQNQLSIIDIKKRNY